MVITFDIKLCIYRKVYLLFISQIGLTAFMDLFKVSPEIRMNFAFLQHYQTEDEKFYAVVSKHSLRVFAVLGKLIKEVPITIRINNSLWFNYNIMRTQYLCIVNR